MYSIVVKGFDHNSQSLVVLIYEFKHKENKDKINLMKEIVLCKTKFYDKCINVSFASVA